MSNGKNFNSAFKWIINILRIHHVPFQISGGLAARAYGSKRKLYDIDIDIPDRLLHKLVLKVKPYIIFGPIRFKDQWWDLKLMTLKYRRQRIDISGANQAKIYNKIRKNWVSLKSNLSNPSYKKIARLKVPVIPKRELIYYKRILSRQADISDIEQITRSS
ncbi:MAG: hypothetical protein WC528_03155 [Patescibacteria group bacterium]